MLIALLDEHGRELGRAQLEGTKWVCGDDGFINTQRLMVLISRGGEISRFNLLDDAERVISRGRFVKIEPSNVSPGDRVRFQPGCLDAHFEPVAKGETAIVIT